MPRDRWTFWTILSLTLSAPWAAFAAPPPVKTTLAVGRPTRSVELTLSEQDGVSLLVGDSTLPLPARGLKSASIESVSVAENAAVAVVRASADNGEWLFLLGGLRGRDLLLAERTDWKGDPGERRATVLEVGTASATGHSTLQVATRYEGVTPCGGQGPWLVDRRALDPKSLALKPQSEPLGLPPDALRLEVSPLETDAPAPRVRALSASASSRVDPATSTLLVPHALVDDNVETTWSAQPGDTALLRWRTSAIAIEGFDVLLGGRAEPTRPVELVLMLEGVVARATLPKPSGTSDGWRIMLPEKRTTQCVALAVDNVGRASTVHISELRVRTEVDHAGGVERLVSELVQDGERGAAAADALADLGAPAASAVVARFEELSPRGRRRALKVLATALSVPEVRARVVEAARSSDEHLRSGSLRVLQQGKEPGLVGLRELALTADDAGDAAARALSLVPAAETPALLEALARPSGADRPALRRALGSLARREPEAFKQSAEVWLQASPSTSARIGFVLVASHAGLSELATSVTEGALAEADSFVDCFRIASVASQLKPSKPLDEWLVKRVRAADEWMLRRASYDALVARDDALAQSLSADVAHDVYPRVRAAAPAVLARAGQSEQLTSLARKDLWPLVRASAATALGTLPAARPTLEELLDDTSRRVRAAAIDALAAQRSHVSWPLVEQRLAATAEWPEVQAAAVRFAAALCVQAARPPLTHVARRSLRPDADDDERRLGLMAIHALHDLGGRAAEDAKLLASREAGSESIERAIARFGPSRCATPQP